MFVAVCSGYICLRSKEWSVRDLNIRRSRIKEAVAVWQRQQTTRTQHALEEMGYSPSENMTNMCCGEIAAYLGKGPTN
jgi:hypothetical protein